MDLSASQEDYLETILGLTNQTGNARVRDIAGWLRVTQSSVSVALRALAKRKLVHYEPYQLVRLTEEGSATAKRILHRHETVSRFFTGTLGVERCIADTNACRIEHAIGDGVMHRLACFMEFMASSDTPARRLPEAFRIHCAEQRRAGECGGCKVAATGAAKSPECHGPEPAPARRRHRGQPRRAFRRAEKSTALR